MSELREEHGGATWPTPGSVTLIVSTYICLLFTVQYHKFPLWTQ